MTVDRHPIAPGGDTPDRPRTRTKVVATLTPRQIQALADLLPRMIAVVVISVRELPPDAPTDTAVLTSRQRQVLAGLARGQISKEVGRTLGVSHRTVDRHVQSLMRKADVHSRHELVQWARALGFIPPPAGRSA